MYWIRWIGRFFVFGLLVLLSIWVGVNSLKYFYPDQIPSAFLAVQEGYWGIYLPVLYGHILSSPILLIIGALGFSTTIRQQSLGTHRWLGRAYVLLVLFVSAPCGFAMAMMAAGGWLVKACFLLLSTLWVLFTYRAWVHIRRKQIEQHRYFMLRSYALSLSAINLRIYSFLGAFFWGWQGAAAYVVLAWASWLPNWLLVEGYVYYSRTKVVREGEGS